METTVKSFLSSDIGEMIRLKKQDQRMQIIMFILSVVLIPFTFLFSMFLMGLTHAVGTLYWYRTYRQLPRLKGRKIIEPINLTVLALFFLMTLSMVVFGDEAFVMAVAGLSMIGPVLGIAYFLVTIYEIRFYQQLLQHERA